MRNTILIDALTDMGNGDAVSDINTFNDFVKDFIISHRVNLKNKKGLSKKSLFP